MAQRSSRKRRKERQQDRRAEEAATVARGYARGRRKDEEARANLKPLAPGERPRAVTVGMWVALVAGAANLVALAIGYDADKGPQNAYTLIGSGLMFLMAYGMWKVRYWAVLGMQALLLITILLATGALIKAANVAALAFTLVLILGSGALFWFLVKSMARIQMPKPPSSLGG